GLAAVAGVDREIPDVFSGHVVLLTRRLGKGAVLDELVELVARAACRDEIAVTPHGAGDALAHQPRSQLADRVDLLRGRVLGRPRHQRHAVPRRVAAGLCGMHAAEPTAFHHVAVRAGAKAVADVGPPTRRPHVEGPGALPVGDARAVRLAG